MRARGRLLRLATAAGIVALLAVGLADASPGPVGYVTTSDGGQDNLVRLHLQTGTMTSIAATGLEVFTVVALSGSTLYGVNVQDKNLYTIDPATASPALIGPTGLTSIKRLTATGDGKLWLTTTGASNLYQVNPSTGQATLVGAIGQGLVSGIAGTCSGHLFGYAAGNLLSIDPATGAGSVIGATGFASNTEMLLASDAHAHLWGVLRVGGQFDTIYRLNVHTGSATFVANTSTNFNSLALIRTCH